MRRIGMQLRVLEGLKIPVKRTRMGKCDDLNTVSLQTLQSVSTFENLSRIFRTYIFISYRERV